MNNSEKENIIIDAEYEIMPLAGPIPTELYVEKDYGNLVTGALFLACASLLLAYSAYDIYANLTDTHRKVPSEPDYSLSEREGVLPIRNYNDDGTMYLVAPDGYALVTDENGRVGCVRVHEESVEDIITRSRIR